MVNILLYTIMYLQIITGVNHRAVASSSACGSLGVTFSTCFNYTQNPISDGGKWDGTSSGCGGGYSAVQAAGAGAFSSGKGCANLIGFTSATPSNKFILDDVASPGVSGICVWESLGNGHCYLINLQQIFRITAGAGTPLGAGDCPSTSGHNGAQWQLSLDGSHNYVCSRIQGGIASGSPVNDTTYNETFGGFIIDGGKTVIDYGFN